MANNGLSVPYWKARELIYSDPQNWIWLQIDNTEVAELKQGYHLQIYGNFDVPPLISGQIYLLNLVVLLKEDSVMNGPVTLSLNGIPKPPLDLTPAPRNIWVWLNVGEFTAGTSTKIAFSLTGQENPNPKHGLVIIGATISGKFPNNI